MPHWTSRQLQDLLEKREPTAIFDRSIELAQALGMTHLGLRLHVQSVARGTNLLFYNNYPPEWNEQYEREELSQIDPIRSMCHHTTLPVLWDETHFAACPRYRQCCLQTRLALWLDPSGARPARFRKPSQRVASFGQDRHGRVL